MIIARKQGENIVVGVTVADSLIDMTKRDLSLLENIPFWKVKGEKNCYVFAEDLTFATDLLRFNDYVFKNITDGTSVVTEVVPKMKELLGKYSQIINGKEWDSQLLIIKDNKMFTIGHFFTVSENNEFVGLGYDTYLIGGLEENRDKSIEESIVLSIKNLNLMRNRNVFPLVLFDVKKNKRKVIFGDNVDILHKEPINEKSLCVDKAIDEDMYKRALQLISDRERVSVQFLQKKLFIGFAKAIKLLEIMTENAFIEPYSGAKTRKVLLTKEKFKEIYGDEL